MPSRSGGDSITRVWSIAQLDNVMCNSKWQAARLNGDYEKITVHRNLLEVDWRFWGGDLENKGSEKRISVSPLKLATVESLCIFALRFFLQELWKPDLNIAMSLGEQKSK